MVNSNDISSYSDSRLGRKGAFTESITERDMAEKGLELGEMP